MSGVFSSPDTPEVPDSAEAIERAAQVNRIDTFIPGMGEIRYSGPYNTTRRFIPGEQMRDIIPRQNIVKIGGLDKAIRRLNAIPEGGFSARNDLPTGLEQAGVGVALRDAGFDMPRRALNLNPQVPRSGQPTPLSLGFVNQLNREGELQEEQFDVPDRLDPNQFDTPTVGGEAGGSLPGIGQATQAQEAQFQRALGLLRPEFERDEERMRQRLANQGIPIGSEAFEDETSRFERERARAREQAAFRAVEAGNRRQGQLFQQGLSRLGAEQGLQGQSFQQGLAGLGARQGLQQQAFGQRRALNQENLATQRQAFGQAAQNLAQRAALQGQEFGQSTQAAQFATQLQQQRYDQELQRLNARAFVRNQNFNELAAALQNAPISNQGLLQTMGGGGSRINTGQFTGQEAAQQQANYQAQVQQQQAQMGGLASLASVAMLAMCSHDYKTNKRPAESILPRIEALPVEAWDYKPGYGDGGTHIGPYAEDFNRLFGLGDGKTIPYIDMFGISLMAIKELYQRVKELEDGAAV